MCLSAVSCLVRPFLLTDVLWNTGDVLKAETDSSSIPCQCDCVTRRQMPAWPRGGLLESSEWWFSIHRGLPLTITSPYGSVTRSLSVQAVSLSLYSYLWSSFPMHPSKPNRNMGSWGCTNSKYVSAQELLYECGRNEDVVRAKGECKDRGPLSLPRIWVRILME